ncbi:MAG: M20/M25/M40 family metallo-hydrolase [Acidobacteria bacterium]|nr:M20/M25/M40 family metallo-hydrolase [Acidobacteriota bacterium]
MRTIALLALAATAATAQFEDISGAKIRAHTRFLSSDLMEGRGVGVRGGDLATEYLATQFELAGAKPAGDSGTYFQRVPLTGVTTQPSVALSAGSLSFQWLDEFVGVSRRQNALDEFDAEAVFVGHGITAPEYQWDDFKDADVRGKVVVLFTNEPQSEDPKLFGGRALTYYGRWTYKYEQAIRKGAAAALIIHTTPTAGYGWEVVRTSWGREDTQVKLAAGQPALAFAGWLTSEAGERLLKAGGHSVAELLKAADERGFRPIPLGVRIRGRIPSQVRQIVTRNVAAIVPGSDAALAAEAVIFSAHWDHLGVGEAVRGDAIYNGSVDNATGCAMLIEIARAWASLAQKPKRSALFLAVTAEEGGLRGSEYYAQQPLVPPGKTAVGLNFDAFFPLGRTRDVVVAGAERTTFYPLVEDAARRFQYGIKPDPRPEQGSYYRSDHFSFAKAGIPAFSIHQGSDFVSQAQGTGSEIFREFNAKHYHQPSDEFHEDWDFSGLEHIARFGMLLGKTAANLERLPTWNAGDEFLPAREKSGVR